MRRGIAIKQILTVIPVLLLVGWTAIWALTLREQETIRQAMDQRISAIADTTAGALAEPLWTFDPDSLLAVLTAVAEHDDILMIEVEDQSTSEHWTVGKKVEDSEQHATSRNILHQQEVIGKLHLVYSEARLNQRIASSWIEYSALVLLLCATVVGTVFAAQSWFVGRPIKLLLYSIHRSRSNGELERVDWKSRDELGEVVAAYNSLMTSVEKHQSEVAEKTAALAHQASTDPLTGIDNRRAFMDRLNSDLARSRRNQMPLGVLILDLDHFKYINDTYGHAAGDAILCHVSRLIVDSLRQGDRVGRLGGEEFGILLPDTDPEGMRMAGERLRIQIAHHPAPGSEQWPAIAVTVSIGGVWTRDGNVSADELLSTADSAMYAAKDGGRNQVVSRSWMG